MDVPSEEPADKRDDAFGARLRRTREAAGLAQEELAERAGLSPNTIGALERGEHRLPYPATVRALAAALGLDDAERAALAAAVPTRGHPAPAPETAPSGLPAPLSPLIGRAREVVAVSALLREDGARLVTLTGPGGVGKTSLALGVATELSPDFAHGAAVVFLAAVRDPALVASTIALALGVVEAGGRSPVDRLGAALRERHLLLLLDNLEHLLDAAPLVTDLLARCPRLAVLATSRAPLRLAGEHVYPVPPLAVPDPDRLPPQDELAGVAAVRLFVARSRAADPAFALTGENADAVAAVCHRLDGLPLAIELAAARSRHLPPGALLPRLARRLPLLTQGRRDAPARHQTMRDAIAWSVDLLTDGERRVFRRLAVCVDGFTLDAAAAVVRESDAPAEGVFAAVATLVDHNLLLLDRPASGAPPTGSPLAARYRMLETIREYGLDQLAAAGEAEETARRHAAFFAALADWSRPVDRGPAGAAELERRIAELGNLRAAMAWVADHGDPDAGARIVSGLWRFWRERGHLGEGRTWAARFLPRRAEVAPVARFWFLNRVGDLALLAGDQTEARVLHDEAVDLAWTLDDEQRVHALFYRGRTALFADDDGTAEARLEEALALARRLGDDYVIALALDSLCTLARRRGDPARGAMLAEEALARSRAIGYDWMVIGTLASVAGATCEQGDPVTATARYRAALDLLAAAGQRRDDLLLAMIVAGFAVTAAVRDQPLRAAWLCGAAEGIVARMGSRFSPVGRLHLARAIAAVDARVAPVDSADHRAAGRRATAKATLAEAVALASDLDGGDPTHPEADRGPGPSPGPTSRRSRRSSG
jgi:predicted ATPase/transcriptional regulator with XRE-family HTH domain